MIKEKICKVRPLNQFMMWNHLIFVWAALRSLYYQEYAFCLIGSITTILSFAYHRSHERGCQPQETYFAKGVIAYIFIMSLLRFNFYQILHILSWEGASALIFYSQDNYGKIWNVIHPWLHVTVGGVCHVYISYHKEKINHLVTLDPIPTFYASLLFFCAFVFVMRRYKYCHIVNGD